ncbi:MAG: 50S ribosomal protein L13 [Oscillospiraceae bacterium]|nr:50S ribosomal protein L13 [Oscillospiraceae bacterium]MBR2740354.1 50S ribosomal protein L13 [Oscillospiraceae bacterium]
MSTTLQKPQEVERRWYIIDAAGKPVGRTATLVANLLRGKNKPTFTPNVDCGDHVIVINCSKAVFTGRKLDQKKYYHHSEYLSGMKVKTARQMMDTTPEKVMYLAVKGMLPYNTLGRKALTRLRVYAGAEHNNAAQKPVAFEG